MSLVVCEEDTKLKSVQVAVEDLQKNADLLGKILAIDDVDAVYITLSNLEDTQD
jgi:hypothetical protein